MTDMQRWEDPADYNMTKSDTGAFVLASDAEAAIAAAEQRGHDEAMDMDPVRRREAYLHGQRDMLAKVRELLTETRASYKAKVRWRDEYRDGAADALLVVSEALDYDERFTNGQEKP